MGDSKEDPSTSRGRTAWQFGPATLDVALGRLTLGGQTTDLDHSTHGILLCLLRSANQVVLKETLLQAGWPERVTSDSSLTKAIHRLRVVLDDVDGTQIRTVHGYGYQLMSPARCIETVASDEVALPPIDGVAPTATAGSTSRLPLVFALVGVALLVAVTAAWGWRATRPAPRTEAALVGEASVPMTKPSVAVMPFQDLSPHKSQQFLGDGMAEEVISLLSKMTTVRVVSRSASFRLRDEPLSAIDIARRLDVEMILQGSVLRDGDKLSVEAKLVRGSDGSTVWSEKFDRKLEDVFAVQREIAVDVLDRLRIQLVGAVPPPRSMNPHAYPLILEADELANKNTSAGNARAVTLYKQAIEISPREVWAWQGLGRVYSNQAGFGEIPRAEGMRLAKMALHRALSIDPDYAFSYANLATIASQENDRRAAAKYFEIAMAKSPGEQGIVTSVAVFLQGVGRLDDAIRLHHFALQRDPGSAIILGDLGVDYYFAGKFPEAIDYSRRSLALSPDYVGAHTIIGTSMLLSGGDAGEALEEIRAEQNEIFRMSALPLAFDALDRKSEADAAFEQFLAKHGESQPVLVAGIHAERHDADRAFEWLEKALVANDSYLPYVPIEPLMRNLHDDPRWTPFLRRAGLTPEQLATIQLRVTLPSPTPETVAASP